MLGVGETTLEVGHSYMMIGGKGGGSEKTYRSHHEGNVVNYNENPLYLEKIYSKG